MGRGEPQTRAAASAEQRLKEPSWGVGAALGHQEPQVEPRVADCRAQGLESAFCLWESLGQVLLGLSILISKGSGPSLPGLLGWFVRGARWRGGGPGAPGPTRLVLCIGFPLMRGWNTVGLDERRPCPLPHPQPESTWGGGRESRASSWLPYLGIFQGLFSKCLPCSL